MPKRKGYDFKDLFDAYFAVTEGGLKISTAAKQYGIPMNTLRDRVRGRTSLECMAFGPKPLFSDEQELSLANYLKEMASSGYNCSRKEVLRLASDFAYELNLRERGSPLRTTWFKSFLKRHPSLNLGKTKAQYIYKDKASPEANVRKYFDNLDKTLEEHNLQDKPHLIYIVDEKGFAPYHSPSEAISARTQTSRTLTVTQPKECVTTIIASGNAMGNSIPPYFVFKGERFHENFIQEGSPGVGGDCTVNGLSNGDIFQKYLRDHFLKYAQRSDNTQSLLLIYGGQKSLLTPGISHWAKTNNIILFVLPAHTSRFLHPLDIDCFPSLESSFVSAEHQKIHSCEEMRLNNSEVCNLACKSYMEGMKPSNLINGFQKTGIYPFVGFRAIDPSILKSSKPISGKLHPDELSSNNIIFQRTEQNDSL